MTTYTYSKARQHFSSVLDQAREKGEIYIKRKDGSLFVLKPFTKTSSPLDVKGIDIRLSKEEISEYLREVRKR
jgi:antitoxin Phd